MRERIIPVSRREPICTFTAEGVLGCCEVMIANEHISDTAVVLFHSVYWWVMLKKIHESICSDGLYVL